MAFWSKKKIEFEQMDELIRQEPGISQAKLAEQLQINRSTVTRRLPALNDAGYFYYEDDDGGLWPFNKK